MSALFAKLAFVHDEDGVGALDGAEAVSDEDAGAAGDHAFPRASADAHSSVSVSTELVASSRMRMPGSVGEGAGEADELLLAGGEGGSSLDDGLLEFEPEGVCG